jgi:hypothetical protein
MGLYLYTVPSPQTGYSGHDRDCDPAMDQATDQATAMPCYEHVRKPTCCGLRTVTVLSSWQTLVDVALRHRECLPQ